MVIFYRRLTLFILTKKTNGHQNVSLKFARFYSDIHAYGTYHIIKEIEDRNKHKIKLRDLGFNFQDLQNICI